MEEFVPDRKDRIVFEVAKTLGIAHFNESFHNKIKSHRFQVRGFVNRKRVIHLNKIKIRNGCYGIKINYVLLSIVLKIQYFHGDFLIFMKILSQKLTSHPKNFILSKRRFRLTNTLK